jgi:hypothetical protein
MFSETKAPGVGAAGTLTVFLPPACGESLPSPPLFLTVFARLPCSPFRGSAPHSVKAALRSHQAVSPIFLRLRYVQIG